MQNFLPACGAIVLGVLTSITRAENILENATFEQPKIEGRIDERKGGSPVKTETGTSWAHYLSMDPSGKVSVGLTNEISRSGTQSIYVAFDKGVNVPSAHLMSDLIPIKAQEKYRLSIWGRLDRKRPLTIDQGRPMMRVQLEYFEADQATQVGALDYRTQMLPGGLNRILFVAGQWSEYFTELKTPEGAEFVKITFYWELPEKEPADGIIYFDDAALDGPRGLLVPTRDPEDLAPPPIVPKPDASTPPATR